MNIDTESEGGSWRREMLARSLTVAQLREIVSEMEHCLSVERRRTRDLVIKLTDAVETEMKLRAEIERLKSAVFASQVVHAKGHEVIVTPPDAVKDHDA
jgi:hypothetical protein